MFITKMSKCTARAHHTFQGHGMPCPYRTPQCSRHRGATPQTGVFSQPVYL